VKIFDNHQTIDTTLLKSSAFFGVLTPPLQESKHPQDDYLYPDEDIPETHFTFLCHILWPVVNGQHRPIGSSWTKQ
jgi:hypothetical protein